MSYPGRQLILWRRIHPLLAVATGLALALWPAWAAAECGPLDAGGCVDGALYNFWMGLASLGWWIDRTLLMAAFQVDALRWWLVDVAFTSAYAALTAALTPFLAPIATAAVIIGCLLFLLLPIAGHVRVIDIRHALVWAVLAPAVMTASGPLIVQLEQTRSGVGVALYTTVSGIAPGAIFGASSSDMRAPIPLYPANPCGVTLERRSGGGLRLDDLAAALLWADAEDIHCPEVGGPGRDIPDAFYEAAPGGAGYAVDMDVSMMPPGTPRSEAVIGIQRGAIRCFVGIIPATLAVLDALVQLLFALGLVALWISLPLGLLFIFFMPNAAIITSLLRRMLFVLQVSWASSIVMGLMVACLIAAAELRNGAAYTGFAIGGGALVLYLLKVAVDTFVSSLRALSEVTATITGLSPAQAAATASNAAGMAFAAGAAAATGGMSAGLVAAAAYRQTGNGTYAAATALGRIRPVAELGEVGQMMGLLESDSPLATGLYAGMRSERSMRAARLQLQTDAARTDAMGRTMRDQAEERRIAGELRWHERPTVVQEVEQAIDAGGQVIQKLSPVHIAAELERFGDQVPAIVSAGWERARSRLGNVRDEVMRQAGAQAGLPRIAAATMQTLDARIHPGGRGQVVHLDARGHISYAPPPATPPDHAVQANAGEANIPRLLMLGYAVQQTGDQVIAWRVADEIRPTPAKRLRRQPAPGAVAAPDSHDNERASLIRAGALFAATRQQTSLPTQEQSKAESAAPVVKPAAAPDADTEKPHE